MTVRFWHPKMTRGGEIEFLRPEQCVEKRHIKEMEIKIFCQGNFCGVEEFSDEEVGL